MTHHHIAWLIVITSLCLASLTLLFGADMLRVGATMLLEFVILLFVALASRVDEVKR